MATFQLKQLPATKTGTTVTSVSDIDASCSSDHHYLTPLSSSDHHYLTPLPSRSDQQPVAAAPHPCRPGRSTTASPRNIQLPVQSSSSSCTSTPTDSAEPFYDTIADPPPSPVEISREVVLPVRANRSRVSTILKCIGLLAGVFAVAVVGALLYVYVPHSVPDSDDCTMNPCMNNATCVYHVDGPHRFTCQCAAGYSGYTCQIDTMIETRTKSETTTEPTTTQETTTEPTTTQETEPTTTQELTTVSGMLTVYNSTPSLVFGGRGRELGRLRYPRGVDVHHLTGIIYVADYSNNRVCEFNSSGHVVSCMSGYSGPGGITVDFYYPLDISVMTNGRMVICDLHRVIVTYSNMTLVHVWGNRTAGQGLGQFDVPFAVASDGDLIYVADHHNRRIQVLNVTSTDDIEVIEVRADNPSELYKPRGIAIDRASGYIFVTGYRSDDGSYITIIIIYNMTRHYVRHVTPSDLGVDKTDLRHIALYRDRVYVSDSVNGCIHILSYTGSSIQRLCHTGRCPGCFQVPWGVAVHSVTGHLIVTDYSNDNVQIFRPL